MINLEKIKWELLAEEGISKEDLELVDLKFGFTPVIPVRNGDPTEVIEARGGYLLPDFPLFNGLITKEELTVMRYRYLINRKRR